MALGEFLNTLIGEGTIIKGDLETTGQVRIDGDLIGSLKTESQVIISPTGRVKGNISARELIVGGLFKGDILTSDKVVILSSGLVLGKIISPLLVIEQGALLDGVCHITPRVKELGAEVFYQPTDYYTVEGKIKQRQNNQESSLWTLSK
jgi:cytoskeletal protein CcmA (bactofilin family)